MRMTFPTAALTVAFGLCAALTGIHTSPAAFGKTTAKPSKKPAASSAAQIAQGKAISEENGCGSCHTATYAGKKGFSPSIRANGVTQKYTLVNWERMMNTGVTEDGGHVNKPMPIYHMPAAKSAPLYAFFKSLK